MERKASPKNKILKYLPKAASAVNFQSHPFSPGRDKIKGYGGKGFSGPKIFIIPDEARRKPKSDNGSFEPQEQGEPTSPKISCMGQIKHKKKMNKAEGASSKSMPADQETKPVVSSSLQVKKKRALTIKRLFTKQEPRSFDASDDDKKDHPLPDRAPSLSQMKRFASGRCSLSGFDWTAQIAVMEPDQRGCYSFKERTRDGNDHEEEEEEEEEEEVMIPFSAPITVGGGLDLQPKKEVSLWKRRTMNPPKPLQLSAN